VASSSEPCPRAPLGRGSAKGLALPFGDSPSTSFSFSRRESSTLTSTAQHKHISLRTCDYLRSRMSTSPVDSTCIPGFLFSVGLLLSVTLALVEYFSLLVERCLQLWDKLSLTSPQLKQMRAGGGWRATWKATPLFFSFSFYLLLSKIPGIIQHLILTLIYSLLLKSTSLCLEQQEHLDGAPRVAAVHRHQIHCRYGVGDPQKHNSHLLTHLQPIWIQVN